MGIEHDQETLPASLEELEELENRRLWWTAWLLSCGI